MLTTNGFGGSKDDQAGAAQAFGREGYVTLSYTGLGFPNSGCKITLDDPDYDGKAATQLVDYLAGLQGGQLRPGPRHGGHERRRVTRRSA